MKFRIMNLKRQVTTLDVGAKIKARRDELGMTIKELSNRTGLSLSSIHYIETGANSPTVNTLRKIARALGVTVAALLDETTADTDAFLQNV